jgi:hypothetical protein
MLASLRLRPTEDILRFSLLPRLTDSRRTVLIEVMEEVAANALLPARRSRRILRISAAARRALGYALPEQTAQYLNQLAVVGLHYP